MPFQAAAERPRGRHVDSEDQGNLTRSVRSGPEGGHRSNIVFFPRREPIEPDPKKSLIEMRERSEGCPFRQRPLPD